MYLPLDKLVHPSTGPSATVRDVVIDSSNIRELTNAVTEQLRRDAAAAGNRRGGSLIMSGRNMTILVVAALILLVASNSLYVIKQTERGVLLQFGEVVDPGPAARLHVKIPL